MEIYIKFNCNIPIQNFKDIQPKDSHLEKLSKIPPLIPSANVRIIRPEISENALQGYQIEDRIIKNGTYFSNFYKQRTFDYISIKELRKK